jgi:hypothetical protein
LSSRLSRMEVRWGVGQACVGHRACLFCSPGPFPAAAWPAPAGHFTSTAGGSDLTARLAQARGRLDARRPAQTPKALEAFQAQGLVPAAPPPNRVQARVKLAPDLATGKTLRAKQNDAGAKHLLRGGAGPPHDRLQPLLVPVPQCQRPGRRKPHLNTSLPSVTTSLSSTGALILNRSGLARTFSLVTSFPKARAARRGRGPSPRRPGQPAAADRQSGIRDGATPDAHCKRASLGGVPLLSAAPQVSCHFFGGFWPAFRVFSRVGPPGTGRTCRPRGSTGPAAAVTLEFRWRASQRLHASPVGGSRVQVK